MANCLYVPLLAGTAVAAGTETIIGSLNVSAFNNPMSTTQAQGLWIFGYQSINVALATTTVTFTLRRGSTIAGSVIADQVTFTAPGAALAAWQFACGLYDSNPPQTASVGIGGAVVGTAQTGVQGLPYSPSPYIITLNCAGAAVTLNHGDMSAQICSQEI